MSGAERGERAGHASYDATGTLSAQRAALSQQDADLGSLETGVATVKRVARVLHDEVDGQNELLDALEADENRALAATGRTTARTAAAVAEGDAYNFRTFCLLLWPLVLLIVLLVEAVIHFIF